MWIDVEQNTDEWLQARLGKITGSGIKDLMTKGRGKEQMFGEGANTYIDTKVTEILTQDIGEQFTNKACDWGNTHEDEAIEVYSLDTWQKVERKGFFKLNDYVGCSPDGVINGNIIEVKCPYNSVNHYKVLKSGEVPKQYLPQVLFNMWVVGADWCDFISYDPRFSGDLKLKVVRVTREDYPVKYKDISDRVAAASDIIEVAAKEMNGK